MLTVTNKTFILRGVMMNVVILSVAMFNVVLLSVVALKKCVLCSLPSPSVQKYRAAVVMIV